MKRQIYAISLLLSFLVVLSHELINHHHHEATAIDLSVIQIQHEADDHHHGDKHHHDNAEKEKEQKDSEKNHNHPFPFHQHLLSTNDLILERTNLTESNTQNQNSGLFYVLVVFQSYFFEPPNLVKNQYRNKSFLIISNYHHVSNALRGPPVFV